MRIQSITNQQFKALQVNKNSVYTEKQTNVVDKILEKTSVPMDNYNERSTLQMLEQDYDMHLYADANSDNKSINLYFSEKAYLNNELSELSRYTPIGIYDEKENVFDITDIENSIIELEKGYGKNFIGSLATVITALGVVLVTVISVINIAKTTKSADKAKEVIVNTKNVVSDTLQKAQKDTVKFFDVVKK